LEFQPNIPERIVLDFELATWKVFAEILPEAWLLGCLFHFQQAIRQKLQALGLIVLFNQCERFSF
jgi:hypothetical protein